jgi:hypothetical protein
LEKIWEVVKTMEEKSLVKNVCQEKSLKTKNLEKSLKEFQRKGGDV